MLSDNYLVKKTAPLIYAEWSKLKVNELKIVEVYLSRIDIQNKNTCVRFTRNEFAELMGYEDTRNLKTKVFDDRLAKFLGQQIKIDLEDGRGYHRFNLFSDAKCYYDPDENKVMVDIDCNPKLSDVFIGIADGQNNGYRYISYRLEKTKNMDSAYSIRLYNMLLDHAWGNYQWTVDLKQLRTLLGATDSSYESFKYFNARLLKKAQQEINELTDLAFDYERIVKGKLTRAIKFKIKRKKNEVPDIIDVEIIEEKEKNERFGYYYSDVKEALREYAEFTHDEIDVIFLLTRNIVMQKCDFSLILPDMISVEIEHEAIKHLNKLALMLKANDDIQNKYKYLIGVLEKQNEQLQQKDEIEFVVEEKKEEIKKGSNPVDPKRIESLKADIAAMMKK